MKPRESEDSDNFEDDEYNQEDEDAEVEEDFTPPPVKRTIKFVVANPKKRASAPSAPPKISPKKRTRASTRIYDEEEEEEEEDEEEEEEDPPAEEDYDFGEEEEVGGNEEVDDEEPDFTKMTARQRARYDESTPDRLMELPQDLFKKKPQLTEEEQQLRRAELARRRKNMSVRRLEEEKQETLDKLLKKRATRSRKVIDEGGDTDSGMGANGDDAAIQRKRETLKHPAVSHWISTKEKFSLSWEQAFLDKGATVADAPSQ